MLCLENPGVPAIKLTNGITPASKQNMFETFQTWALKTYGDSGKTKTVTRKKYNRIVRILTGDEESSTENSKFRFWVKAKGFRLGPLNCDFSSGPRNVLYVPIKQPTDQNYNEPLKVYRRVAIVDDFFDIIYGVHVETDGRGGKHAGQKRTYRAIAETYSFLPREAVTRFLMACADCQKRMHITPDTSPRPSPRPVKRSSSGELSCSSGTDDLLLAKCNGFVRPPTPHIIDFSVPITQTYLNHLRNLNGYFPHPLYDEESLSGADSEMSTETAPSPQPEDGPSSPKELKIDTPPFVTENGSSPNPVITSKSSPAMDDYLPLNMSNVASASASASPSPREDKGHPERKRRASEDSLETSSKTSDAGTNEDSKDKDDDDDDDNDDEDKVPVGSNIDPERLKSFNMFCRLFVDENLDRIIPISKQPKDKVQAILDACDRQFPEFHIRSRKRIRTYLKSCRRMRRSKEGQNGWEPLRPTPPHLTSAAAEHYLAQACENESKNAQRMRMGLEPLPANVMNPITITTPAHPPPSATTVNHKPVPQASPTRDPSLTQPTPTPTSTPHDRHTPASTADFIRHQPPLQAFRPPPEFHPPFFTNGNGLFRPGFPAGYQHPAHHHPPVLHSPIQPVSLQNGPTDLSMKKQSSKNQLSSSEVATIKQLISGYRESAAFLYRSADELEQLLLQQN